jgi:hypothetical protein
LLGVVFAHIGIFGGYFISKEESLVVSWFVADFIGCVALTQSMLGLQLVFMGGR